MGLNSGIQTYQILTNDDEVCIPSLSSILLAACICLSVHVCFRNRIANRWSNQKLFTQKAFTFALRTRSNRIKIELIRFIELLKETSRFNISFWFKPCPTAISVMQEAVSAKFVIKGSNNIWRSINNFYKFCSPQTQLHL